MSTRLKRSVRGSELSRALARSFEGEDLDVEAVAPLSAAREGALLVMPVPGAVAALRLPSRVLVLASERPPAAAWIATESPRLDFVRALRWLDAHAGFEGFVGAPRVHPTASIGSGSTLGRGVVVGEGTVIGHHVRIADGVRIGSHCAIKSGAVIGEDGFGFERDGDGTPIGMIHLGGVILGDRVDVGTFTTICQGTLAPTIVEDDVKIDAYVHIAHNCWIKKKTIIGVGVKVGVGATVGEGSVVSPGSSVHDSVRIGDGVNVGAGAVVICDVAAGATVAGAAAGSSDAR